MLAPELEEVRQRLIYDTPFWARHCATILNPQRRPVMLEARPWQARTPETPAHVTPLDEALECQRAQGLPMRAIILKARKLGFCLDPATRVLTADLRWETLDTIEPGQEIVATDEHVPGGRGRGRKMRRAVVQAKRVVREDAFLLTMDNGERLVATGPHRFLQRNRGGTEAIWRTVSDTRVGDYIRFITRPWEAGGHEDGWVGGMIDGEGSFAGKKSSADLSISQRPGAVYDRTRDYMLREGYSFREEISDRSTQGYEPCCKVVVGRMNELFRLIGRTRPTRFVDSGWWEGRDLPGKRTGVAWSRVVSIKPLGPRRMIDLQTDRKTFIAEGFVSHNSTWVQAKFMQRVSQLPFQYALTVAHERTASSVLYDMAALMRERLPSDAQLAELLFGAGTGRGAPFSVRPELLNKGESRNGKRWMVLGDRMRRTEASIYETLTAGAKGGGRASTPSMIHGSEVAHYDDPEYLTGLMSALPLEEETIGVLESTANGFNHFHELWALAVAGEQDPVTGVRWTPLFYGWQDNPRNALPFVSAEARERFERTIGDPDGGGDEDEPWLVESFGVSLEQLAWRRVVRDGPECRGSLERFHQEHPATPEQAFIGSGNPVFAAILVSKAIKAAEAAPEPVQGVLAGEDWRTRRTRAGTVEVPQRAVWVPDSGVTAAHTETWGGMRERLLVWEHPLNAETQAELEPHKRQPDGQYVVFVDVAQGQDTTSEVRDYSVIQVLDHLTRMQVARYRSRIAIHDLPLVALLVALYYNGAWLAVEKTGLGIGVVDALAKDYRYPRMYRTRRPGDDRRADSLEQRLGWETTPRTKPLMEMTFGDVLKTGEHGLRDVLTGREFTTYIEDEKGKHRAQKGAHDDLAMGFMGVHRVASELRPKDPNRKPKGPRRRIVDDVTGY